MVGWHNLCCPGVTKVNEVLIGGCLYYIVIFNRVRSDDSFALSVTHCCSDFIVVNLAAKYTNFAKFWNWNLVNILQNSFIKY